MNIEETTIIWNDIGDTVHAMVLHVRPSYSMKPLCGARILGGNKARTGLGVTNCPDCQKIIAQAESYEALHVYNHGDTRI